jgi:hypothetical protein
LRRNADVVIAPAMLRNCGGWLVALSQMFRQDRSSFSRQAVRLYRCCLRTLRG